MKRRWAWISAVFNHADYRLMSKRAVEGLAGFTEVNLFRTRHLCRDRLGVDDRDL